MNGILISICTATSLDALLFEGATIAHSLFGYPVEDETDVDDQNLATYNFKKKRSEFLHEYMCSFGMNSLIMIACSWKQFWRNSRQDGTNSAIMSFCALETLLR